MALNTDIRLRKGSIDLSLFTITRVENSKNAIQYLPPIQGAANHDLGPKDVKAVDLLKITGTYTFTCEIVPTESPAKTVKEIKDELKELQAGAGIKGGTPITLTYEGDDISVYIDDLVFRHNKNDNANGGGYNGYDSSEYTVTISMTKAVAVA